MAFTLWPWIDRSARVGAIVGTTYLLIATSAIPPDPQVCLHETEKMHLLVDGTCGPSTIITIVSQEDECPIAVLNATAADLPAAGRFSAFEGTRVVGLRTDPWTLSGHLLPDAPDGGNFVQDAMSDAALVADADDGDTGADAGTAEDAGELPDALFVPPGGGGTYAPVGQRHCKVFFEQGVPKTLACYASAAQMDVGPPTCTASVVEVAGP